VERRTFKLNTPTSAILEENDAPRVVTVPANAVVTLVGGDTEGNGFVKVRYRDQVLSVFAVDLRNRGERQSEQTA
jgi:hypothetical protein